MEDGEEEAEEGIEEEEEDSEDGEADMTASEAGAQQAGLTSDHAGGCGEDSQSDEEDDDKQGTDPRQGGSGSSAVRYMLGPFFARSLTDAFHVYLQYMVSVFVDIDFPAAAASSDDYFSTAVTRVTRELTDRQRYCIESSAWNPRFRECLHAYPVLRLTDVAFDGGCCMACDRERHWVSTAATFSGERYNEETFRPLAAGNRHTQEYRLGRQCAARAKLFHRLQHYPHALYLRCGQRVIRTQAELAALAMVAEPGNREAMLVRRIMRDDCWIGSCWSEFLTLLDDADQYRNES